MRERELKQRISATSANNFQSLPMRERELKQQKTPLFKIRLLSLPMRERELKLFDIPFNQFAHYVAPHAGARIETCCFSTI